MLYLSHILGAKVKDSSDKTIGRLKDILIKTAPGLYSPLEALMVKKQGQDFYIPYHYVENLSREEVTIKTLADKIIPYTPAADDVFLLKDVMDQQIVDTAGARVVRVNDLQIGLVEEKMGVLGIDISLRGLLRRLGLTKFGIFNWLRVDLIDWKQTQPIKGILKLETLSKDLVKLHPADLANIIEDLNIGQGSELVQALDAETAAKILEEVNPRVQKILMRVLGPEKAAKISERMSINELVDLIKLLPYHEAKEVCACFKNGRLKKVEKLLRYADDTAGGLMTTEFVTVRPSMTVAEVIDEIKKVSDAFRSILYIYVIDESGVYKGVVSLRRLLTAKSDELIEQVMIKKTKRLPCARVHQSAQEVAKLMTKYDLNSVAVVDKDHRLLGVIMVDDVMRQLVPQA